MDILDRYINQTNDMNHINQLRCAVAVAQHRNFSRAAEAVGISQSALSQSIQRLEELHGVEIFERDRRGVRLTHFGEVIVEKAQVALDALREADRHIALLKNLEIGHLVIGADPYLVSALVAPALTSLLDAHPNLKFSLISGDWERMEKPLLENEIDVFFGFPPEHTHSAIEANRLEIPNALVLCRPDHPLNTGSPITLRQVIDFPIVSPTPPNWFVEWAQQQVEEYQDAAAVAAPIILRTDNPSVMKQVTLQGKALMAAFYRDISREVAAGDLEVIKVEDWPMTIDCCIAVNRARASAPAVEMLSSALIDAVGRESKDRKGLASSPKRKPKKNR